MNDTHDVISALLDNEPFDAGELSDALSDPAGRALLIDLALLRRIVQPGDPVPAAPGAKTVGHYSWRPAAAAAALFLALGGGYVVGEWRADTAATAPPAPTRVVEAESFAPNGGMR
jgi:hypothetical protein